MQLSLEVGYQLSTYSATEENHGKAWSSWPVAGPSRGVLASSQPAVRCLYTRALLLASPYLCRCFVWWCVQSDLHTYASSEKQNNKVYPEEPGSSVIMSDYGLDNRAIGVRSPAGAKDFSSNLSVHPASCTMGTGGPIPGGKSRPGRDADHSPPSSAGVKN
jgi:hypothetical protein